MGAKGICKRSFFSAKDTTDSLRSVDVRRWARDGLLRPATRFHWQWRTGEEVTASIEVQIETRHALRLNYRSRSPGTDWKGFDYPVLMDWTPCHFGGERPWFRCPAKGCGSRAAKLYGGAVFACRRCHDLAYPSQQEAALDRAARRCERLRARLGWGGGIFDFPEGKPKGMHRRTYERLRRGADDAAREACDLLLGRYGHDPATRRLIASLMDFEDIATGQRGTWRGTQCASP